MTRVARLSLGLLLAVALAGCTRWQHVQTMPAPGEEPRTFDAGRVTTAQGGMVVLRDVEVTPDSVIGWHGSTKGRRQRVAVPRTQVLAFDRRAFDPWGTAGVSFLVLVTTYAGAVVYVLANVEV